MAILDTSDQDFTQLWRLITELSEQLNQNRMVAVGLYTQAGNLKNQVVHSQSGFVLRRFNMDLSQDDYDAELEKMNATINQENQALQHDNKQLNVLIKEYEQTLETLMSNFRNRARDVQERELLLIREYESKLLVYEEANANQELRASTAISDSLGRVSHLLRQFLRLQGGEEVADSPPPRGPIERTGTDGDGRVVVEGGEEEAEVVGQRESWTEAVTTDHALEREIELARLEKENEELRRMLGLVPALPRRAGSDPGQIQQQQQNYQRHQQQQQQPYHQAQPQPQQPHSFEARRAAMNNNRLGGAAGTVGPFGTYKRLRSPGL